MDSGAQSSSLWTGWRLSLLSWWTFNIWVRLSGRYKAGGKGDLSDNLNAAAPSCWKSDLDACTISFMSELYAPDAICLFWAHGLFFVAPRLCLPCHISKKSWTLAILYNFLSSATFFIFESFSVFIVSNAGSSPANIRSLARANCLATTFSRRVLPVQFDCPQPITSRPRVKLASTLTWCGRIGNLLRATFHGSADCECKSSWRRHRPVMPGIENVLLISIGSEW